MTILVSELNKRDELEGKEIGKNHVPQPLYCLVGKKPRDLATSCSLTTISIFYSPSSLSVQRLWLTGYQSANHFTPPKSGGIQTVRHLQSTVTTSAPGLVILLALGHSSGSGGKRSVGLGVWPLEMRLVLQ
jgi:hypothetical protein